MNKLRTGSGLNKTVVWGDRDELELRRGDEIHVPKHG